MTTDTSSKAQGLDALNTSIKAFVRLVSQGRVIEEVLRRSRIELSRPDVQFLHALLEAEDGVRPGDLADRMQVDAPTVTRRLQLLEARHLVRRTADPLDRRAHLVQLTPAGARMIERAMAVFHDWLEEVLADWAEGEREQFASLLERFTVDVYSTIE